MIYGCRDCTNNVSIPGKHRGVRIRDWACPCGGALQKGRNAEGASVIAVPLKVEEQGNADQRVALKRSTARPHARGAVKLEVLVLLAVAPFVLAGVIYLGIWAYRRWKWTEAHRVICDKCGIQLEDGAEPTVFGRCLSCRYRVREGLVA